MFDVSSTIRRINGANLLFSFSFSFFFGDYGYRSKYGEERSSMAHLLNAYEKTSDNAPIERSQVDSLSSPSPIWRTRRIYCQCCSCGASGDKTPGTFTTLEFGKQMMPCQWHLHSQIHPQAGILFFSFLNFFFTRQSYS